MVLLAQKYNSNNVCNAINATAKKLYFPIGIRTKINYAIILAQYIVFVKLQISIYSFLKLFHRTQKTEIMTLFISYIGFPYI